ncbi:hypothetical protein D1872_335250 [compost metagenome]
MSRISTECLMTLHICLGVEEERESLEIAACKVMWTVGLVQLISQRAQQGEMNLVVACRGRDLHSVLSPS